MWHDMENPEYSLGSKRHGWSGHPPLMDVVEGMRGQRKGRREKPSGVEGTSSRWVQGCNELPGWRDFWGMWRKSSVQPEKKLMFLSGHKWIKKKHHLGGVQYSKKNYKLIQKYCIEWTNGISVTFGNLPFGAHSFHSCKMKS